MEDKLIALKDTFCKIHCEYYKKELVETVFCDNIDLYCEECKSNEVICDYTPEAYIDLCNYCPLDAYIQFIYRDLN